MAASQRVICASRDLQEGGQGVRFVVSRYGQEVPAFAVRFQGEVRAYLNRCTHVPIELDWQQGEFFDHTKLYLVCATHGALYAPESGHCLGGRCNGRGLTPVAVEERDGAVYFLESD
ncbi:MAG TPA: Rieske 2Fe-2S domain-containing protein [Azospira sp.]|nr:Rieske 2Fe-2S domain-containing protein [Azospira sp.]